MTLPRSSVLHQLTTLVVARRVGRSRLADVACRSACLVDLAAADALDVGAAGFRVAAPGDEHHVSASVLDEIIRRDLSMREWLHRGGFSARDAVRTLQDQGDVSVVRGGLLQLRRHPELVATEQAAAVTARITRIIESETTPPGQALVAATACLAQASRLVESASSSPAERLLATLGGLEPTVRISVQFILDYRAWSGAARVISLRPGPN